MCIALCTIVAHNIAQNRPDNFPSYPPDNHHRSDDVYLREGGYDTIQSYRSRSVRRATDLTDCRTSVSDCDVGLLHGTGHRGVERGGDDRSAGEPDYRRYHHRCESSVRPPTFAFHLHSRWSISGSIMVCSLFSSRAGLCVQVLRYRGIRVISVSISQVFLSACL